MMKASPYMTGKMLDAGCGSKRYRDLFLVSEYIGLENEKSFNPDILGDIKYMPFEPDEFDSILNNQVLEHVDDTHRVFAEFARVLKPGGHLCLTVPFVSRIHGIPSDYWRFSEFGIRYLFEKHGFDEIFIQPMGGFLTTQCYLWTFWFWEVLQNSKIGRIVRKPLMFIMNIIALFIHPFDHDRSTPFNYIAVGRKR
ncbi:MAG: class I SAM-dependent methyltransferase [Marinifilaceae bacterium]|nr:class I SAM-dependent methyltransferase [Marinifilaceae bacterium]